MSTLNLSIPKWVLTNLKPVCISLLAVLFAFSVQSQIPGQLPVNLKVFKAHAESNNKVKVFWTTEYEKDNAYFDIERSADGVNFTLVGRVAGINNNGILTDYYYYDAHSMKGISFYRLKQVDVDTRYSYSPIERVKNSETENSFDVYPNPAVGSTFKINLLKNVSDKIDVLVFDQGGRLQLKQQIINNNTVSIDHHLPAGVYSIRLTDKDFTETKKLVIQ